MENALYVTYQAYGPMAWMLRPICVVILIIAVATIVFTALRARKNSKDGTAVKIQETDNEDRLAGLVFLFLMVGVFFVAAWQAWGWGKATGQFPLVVTLPAIGLGILACVRDGNALRQVLHEVGGKVSELLRASTVVQELPRVLLLLASLVAIVGITVLAGQAIAIPIFILAYLKFRGGTSWLFAASYAVIAGLILYFMFGELIGILWYPSILIDYG